MTTVSDLELLPFVAKDTQVRRVAGTKGGEYAGPCPFCGGRDRLRVWPNHPRGRGQWWCRRCGKGGDLIAYKVERGDLTPKQAGELRRQKVSRGVSTSGAPQKVWSRQFASRSLEWLAPPSRVWQRSAQAFVEECMAALWSEVGQRALAWLRARGLADDTIRAGHVGYNPKDQRQLRSDWGLSEGKPIWLPRGIVLPWFIHGDLWRVNIRRPRGRPKYFSPAGFSNALYNASTLSADKPAILVEGEFDALILSQTVGDLVTPVAAGSTCGARRPRWIAALSLCPLVLVSFDAEEDKGDRAAAWWVEVLPNARRWRPLWVDANAMAQAGVDLRGWVLPALEQEAHSKPQFPAAEYVSDRAASSLKTEETSIAQPWEGQRVRLENLLEFRARWGLVTVSSEWPEGAPRPTVYMQPHKRPRGVASTNNLRPATNGSTLIRGATVTATNLNQG